VSSDRLPSSFTERQLRLATQTRLPETPNRVETHVSHRKQTIGCRSTRDATRQESPLSSAGQLERGSAQALSLARRWSGLEREAITRRSPAARSRRRWTWRGKARPCQSPAPGRSLTSLFSPRAGFGCAMASHRAARKPLLFLRHMLKSAAEMTGTLRDALWYHLPACVSLPGRMD
jgi:hypothetical protein